MIDVKAAQHIKKYVSASSDEKTLICHVIPEPWTEEQKEFMRFPMGVLGGSAIYPQFELDIEPRWPMDGTVPSGSAVYPQFEPWTEGLQGLEARLFGSASETSELREINEEQFTSHTKAAEEIRRLFLRRFDILTPLISWTGEIQGLEALHVHRLSKITSWTEQFRKKIEGYCRVQRDSSTLLQILYPYGVYEESRSDVEQLVSIEFAIYSKFHTIKQVQSMYIQDLDKVYNTFIFLQHDHYDEELMDYLLDREGEILDTYQDTLFNFHYLPLFSNAPEHSIPENAKLIFSR